MALPKDGPSRPHVVSIWKRLKVRNFNTLTHFLQIRLDLFVVAWHTAACLLYTMSIVPSIFLTWAFFVTSIARPYWVAESLFTNKIKIQSSEKTCLLSTERFRKPILDGAQFQFVTQAGLGRNFDQSELSAAIRTRHLLNKLGIFLSWLSVFSVRACYYDPSLLQIQIVKQKFGWFCYLNAKPLQVKFWILEYFLLQLSPKQMSLSSMYAWQSNLVFLHRNSLWYHKTALHPVIGSSVKERIEEQFDVKWAWLLSGYLLLIFRITMWVKNKDYRK